MEHWFPGRDGQLARAGALSVNWTADLVAFTPAGWGPRFPSNFTTRTCSRGLLEHLIRQRVTAIKNIAIEPRCEAVDLVAADRSSIITGVKVRYRDRSENDVATLSGDLIVDASGRSSRSLERLSALGYPAPDETIINAHVGYATRVYRRPANLPADWKSMMVRTRPPFGLRGGVIYPVENDLWMVNLGGAGDESPPTDDASFLDFTQTLIHPAFHEAIKGAEPVSPVYAYQRTENRLRHFERLARWPEHLILLGDAACAFNPIYGQGMTVAALEVLALDRWLRAPRSSLTFQKQIMDVVRAPWLMATNEDSRLPGVQAAAPGRLDKFFQDYVDQVIWLCSSDPFAFETFTGVTHLVKPSTALLHPRIAVKFARSMLRKEQPHGQPTDRIPPAPSMSQRRSV